MLRKSACVGFAVVFAFIACWPLAVGAASPSAQGELSIPAANWMVVGGESNAHLGYSVAGAGDVNGDGFDDVIVGAPDYDHGEVDEGRALVYYGSAQSPTGTPWIAEVNQAGARFGTSVHSAGDVNDDGYDDVIIGAPGYNGSQQNSGAAFLYLGSAAGLSATPARILSGEQGDSAFGTSVAGAGDVNGDGYDDVVVGAPMFTWPDYSKGKAYVYLGASAEPCSVMAQVLRGDMGSTAQFGAAVDGAGDVNADGFDDVVVGAPYGLATSKAFVFYGEVNGVATTPWSYAPGDILDNNYGASVAGAGDVNDDGFDDVLIGEPYLPPRLSPDNLDGTAYLFFGSASGPDGVWRPTTGYERFAGFGISVAGAGDVNGDGFADLFIGADLKDEGVTDQGLAYLYLGRPDHPDRFASWSVEGGQANAHFGFSVAGAGDVNGDGYDDLLAGAPLYDSPQPDEGGAFLYFGSPDLVVPTVGPTPTRTATVPTPTATRTVPPTGTQTFQYGVNGYTASYDTELVSWYPTSNFYFSYGGTEQIRAKDQYAVVIQFDVSVIPSNAVVTDATLRVYATSLYGSQPVTLGAYRINRTWIDWQATWLNATFGQLWTVAGCNGVPEDRQATPESEVAMQAISTFYDFDVTDAAQLWVSHPGQNHGLALKTFSNTGGIFIAANEHGGADLHPKLTIHYTVPAVTPTATSTPTRTATRTATATATSTRTPTRTATPTSAATRTSTATNTATQTATASVTSTAATTMTATSTPTATWTPTQTAAVTATETPTATLATGTATATAMATATSTATLKPTAPPIWLPLLLK